MKLRNILNEVISKKVHLEFLKWLKDNNLEYEKVAGGKGKDSQYYDIIFDNGTELPNELRIRFSNHPAGNNAVDIDTYQDHLNTLEDIFVELEREFGLVIQNKKYLGQKWKREWDSETHSWKKNEMEIKRG